ncbi:cell division protein FtsK [Sphaerisporangium rubeum]|uniref:S-DNA-T family DNA segregation ATPase FtsK/SpoIIIE n=1 Tax=Sphaerisporangium rubeum TaxID=321317 RepID=A0A7X0IKV9_9ACTN|nr:cell division protein FtsK [Sphaerisporangium rubeum]MBB6476619.1 S-DNA-T family DNA segregation ATPase FtsK/SpoIIIE [Sphaerisporangium rubeum]
MRRNARRIRRDGIEPMMILSDDLEFAPIALVTIARGMWRYRSELAPVTAALLTLTSGTILHAAYAVWWPIVLILAALTSWVLAFFGRWVNLTRPAERGYAAATVLLAGGWTAAATAVGPSAVPLPHVLAIGTFVTGLPWWAHRRRRARVRVERTLAAWPEISQAIGLAGSRIQSAVVDLWGYRARVALARGQTVEDVVSKLPALESALGTRRGAARVQPVPERANRMELRVIENDPHADAIAWPGPSVTSITQPVKLGLFEDGSPVRVSLLRRHVLVGGVAGAGKSGGVNVILADLSACPDVVIWGIDLKRGMELLPWASCLDRVATTAQEAQALLRDAVAVLDGRADVLAQQGQRVWQPRPDAPALVILIDEYAELVDEAPEAVRHADSIARRGRAVAVTLVAATQRPSQKAMGQGAVRSQMDVRISFRVRERRDVDLILGQGMFKAGWHSHSLNAPGKFLVSAPEHDIPRRARTFLLTDDAVQCTTGRHASNRPPLDEISTAALEATPTSADEDAPAIACHGHTTASHDAENTLWTALRDAPGEGMSIEDLMRQTGMGRSWVYYRLQEHARSGRVAQVSRGRWRAHPDS